MKGNAKKVVIILGALVVLLAVSAIAFVAYKRIKINNNLASNQADSNTTEGVGSEENFEVSLKIDDAHTIVVECPKGYQDFMSGEISAWFIKENIRYNVLCGNKDLESAKENITSTVDYMKDNTDTVIGEPIIGEEIKYEDYDANYSSICQKIDGEFLYTYIIHIDIGAEYTVKATVEAPEEMEKEEMLKLIKFSVK